MKIKNKRDALWYKPRNLDKPNFEFFIMAKLSIQDKINVYNLWKHEYLPIANFAKRYSLNHPLFII